MVSYLQFRGLRKLSTLYATGTAFIAASCYYYYQRDKEAIDFTGALAKIPSHYKELDMEALKKNPEHLTVGTLRGPGKLSDQRAFYDPNAAQFMGILHIGKQLCGHPGVTHGGLLATIIDEYLALASVDRETRKIPMTARLTLNYRKPVFTDQVVVVRSRQDKVDGRKCFVSGTIETVGGHVVLEADALFIHPK